MKLLITLCIVAVASAGPSGSGFGPKPEKERQSTIMAGLPAEFIEMPRKLTREEVEWLVQPVEMDDLKGMMEHLMGVQQDLMEIGEGFMKQFSASDFASFIELRDALKAFFVDVILPKELDLEGVKDYVDGMLVRGVISGTDIPELEGMNEPGCINLKSEKKDPAELSCIFHKVELMEKAVELAQWASYMALYDAQEQMQWCDSVFRLMENPQNVTANDIVAALMQLGECFFANGRVIEERLNPDRPGPDGKPVVPFLPIPRLIALSVKMEAYEFMGIIGFESYMIVQGFLQYNAPEDNGMPGNMTADMPKFDKVRDVVDNLKDRLSDMKKGKGPKKGLLKCKKFKALMEKMGGSGSGFQPDFDFSGLPDFSGMKSELKERLQTRGLNFEALKEKFQDLDEEDRQALKQKIMQKVKDRMGDISGSGFRPRFGDFSGMKSEMKERLQTRGLNFEALKEKFQSMDEEDRQALKEKIMEKVKNRLGEMSGSGSGFGPKFRAMMTGFAEEMSGKPQRD